MSQPLTVRLGGDEVLGLIIEGLKRRQEFSGTSITIDKVVVNMIGPVLLPDQTSMLIHLSDKSERITGFTLSVEVKTE